jgi:hypothetical protein
MIVTFYSSTNSKCPFVLIIVDPFSLIGHEVD